MACFVIVHGAWGGGWEWRAVGTSLRAAGHEVFTPTLTGMGERAHLGSATVGLATHVEDVCAVLEIEDLESVVLCAHSSGGMPATGAADRLPDRIALLVYIDALVPSDGQSAFDLLPAGFASSARAAALTRGDGWRVPIPEALVPPEGWMEEGARLAYIARLRDIPLASFAEPIDLTAAVDRVPRAFVRCTATGLADQIGEDPIAPIAAGARNSGWLYRELTAPHDPQLVDPEGLAAILEELATSVR